MELTAEEIGLLREILETARADLKEEIYKTEDTDYRKALKAREQALDELMTKVERATPSHGPETLRGPHVTAVQ